MSDLAESLPDSFLAFVSWPTLWVHGPDAATWLNGIVTCNVLSVGHDAAVWGSLLNKQGKVRADLQILGSRDDLFVAISGGDAKETLSDLERYLVMEDAEIELSDRGWVIAYGDQAEDVMRNAGLKLARLSWPKADIYAACASPAQLEELRTGAEVLAASEATLGSWLTFHGVPRFGVDYGPKDNLHAASLERRTVDWQKGCYLGQEVVCMQDMRGKVKRRLVQIEGSGPLVGSGSELTAGSEDEVVGHITSSAGSRAIGSVSAPYFEPGSQLSAGGEKVTVQALGEL